MAKATQAQVEQRITVIMAMLLDGNSVADISKYAEKTWGISYSTLTETYLPRANERIIENERGLQSNKIDMTLSMHYRLLAKEINGGHFAAANRTLDMINKIRGVYAPTRSELTGREGGAIELKDTNAPDFSGWTIEQLLEWRKAANGEE